MFIKSFKKVTAIITITVFFVFWCGFSGSVEAAGNSTGDAGLDYIQTIKDMIKEVYNGEISDEQLIEGAVRGMFNTMDPYTVYFTDEEAESFFNDLSGTYEGIGISFAQDEDYIIVVKVFPASPAEKAGIISGDRIVAVDGESIVGSSTEEVASLIKGAAGTKVTLSILRGGEAGEIITLEVERTAIKVSPVTWEIKGDIGYIRLEMFNENAYEFMQKALDRIDETGVNKIILDLRDNPGGDVGQAVEIAGRFVPKGLITKLDFKSDEISDEEYYSFMDEVKYDLVVLVNDMTASAAEILAGAIQDSKAGVLVGTKTFGKAKVQNIIPLLTPEAYKKYSNRLGQPVVNAYDLIENGIMPKKNEIAGYTKITTGTYTTPKGKMIDGEGLTPDIVVESTCIVEGIDVRGIQKLAKVLKPDLNDEGIDVYNAEKILKLLGYSVDNPDMRMDEKTYQAIWKFREDNGLYPGGVLDYTTQDLLNRKLEELILKYDAQYSKAIELLKQSETLF